MGKPKLFECALGYKYWEGYPEISISLEWCDRCPAHIALFCSPRPEIIELLKNNSPEIREDKFLEEY